jgi:hypothetical protein
MQKINHFTQGKASEAAKNSYARISRPDCAFSMPSVRLQFDVLALFMIGLKSQEYQIALSAGLPCTVHPFLCFAAGSLPASWLGKH